MRLGLLGKKLGMTQIFTETTVIPVTVIQVGPCTVIQKKTPERDKYEAIQLGFLDKKETRCTKPELGHFKAAGVTPKKVVQEIRLQPGEVEQFEVGQELRADIFEVGQYVDVTGTSKGKGFQGVMKRHNFSGFEKTHGTHEYFRHGGAIGCRLTPGRVWKGKRMAGQMGNRTVTVQNLEVCRVDVDRNLIMVKGAVPGATNGYVTVYHAKKKTRRAAE